MQLNETFLAQPIIEETQREKLPDGVLSRVTYPICNIGERNANDRVYEDAVFDKVLEEKDIQEKMANRALFGHAEHPEQTQSNLEKTSHVIFEMWKDNGKFWQRMDVLDTPTGRIVDTLLRAGCNVGVSTRAEGDLEEAEDDEGSYQRVVPERYRYVTTDFTADPSTFGAVPEKVERNIVPTIRKELENKNLKPDEKEFVQLILEGIQCKDGKCIVDSVKRIAKRSRIRELKSLSSKTIKEAIEDKTIKVGTKLRYGDNDAKVKKIDETKANVNLTVFYPDSPEDKGVGVGVSGDANISISPEGLVTILPTETIRKLGMEEKEPQLPPPEGRLSDEDMGPAEEEPKEEIYTCECLECGHTMESEQHCRDIKCPECGGEMRRKERPGSGQATEEIPEGKISVEGGALPGIRIGNVLRDKQENHYTVKRVNPTGMSIGPIGGVGDVKFVRWDQVEDLGLVKVGESKVDETEDIKAMYKASGLPAPDGKGIHTKAFHELVIKVAKGYVEGGDTPEEALNKAYPTAMKQLGKEKAVKKAHQKNESIEEETVGSKLKEILDVKGGTNFPILESVENVSCVSVGKVVGRPCILVEFSGGRETLQGFIVASDEEAIDKGREIASVLGVEFEAPAKIENVKISETSKLMEEVQGELVDLRKVLGEGYLHKIEGKSIWEQLERVSSKELSGSELSSIKDAALHLSKDIYPLEQTPGEDVSGYFRLDNGDVFKIEEIEGDYWVCAKDRVIIDKVVDFLRLEKQWEQEPVAKAPSKESKVSEGKWDKVKNTKDERRWQLDLDSDWGIQWNAGEKKPYTVYHAGESKGDFDSFLGARREVEEQRKEQGKSKGYFVKDESISTTSKELVDLRIKEASTRAERDKALELFEELAGNDEKQSTLESRMLASRVKRAIEAKDIEVDALRSKLEEKARVVFESQKKIEEMSSATSEVEEEFTTIKANLASDIRKLEEDVRATNEGHVEAISQLETEQTEEIKQLEQEHNESIEELKKGWGTKIIEEVEKARKEVTSDFIKCFTALRLEESGLKVGDNSRALLESCKSIEEVDDLFEEILDASRRGALHSKIVESVKVSNRIVDPEQIEAERTVGNALEGMSG